MAEGGEVLRSFGAVLHSMQLLSNPAILGAAFLSSPLVAKTRGSVAAKKTKNGDYEEVKSKERILSIETIADFCVENRSRDCRTPSARREITRQ